MNELTDRATILCKWNSGPQKGAECFFPFYGDEVWAKKEPVGLEERIEWARNFNGPDGFIPVAWTHKDSGENHATAIAAGRVIEKIGDSYVPRGVAVESKTQFRVGGVYRQRKGDLVVLRADSMLGDDEGIAWEVSGDKFHRGARRLSDGKAYPYDGTGEIYDLLPGELHQVNGQWVPVEEKPAGLAPLIRKQQEAIEEGEPTSYTEAVRQEYELHAAEPKRPALTWNQPTKTDRFPGFTVKKGSISQPAPQSKFSSPDLQASSHLVKAEFGSADLIG